MPKAAPDKKSEHDRIVIVAGASGTAADLVKDNRTSTWTEIFEKHPAAVPRWASDREEAAQARSIEKI